jgi:hypothetical protein
VGLEARGIPTAAICTDPFLEEARAQARALGMPDLPVARITHPLSTLTAEEIAQRAAEAVPQLLGLLIEPPGCG